MRLPSKQYEEWDLPGPEYPGGLVGAGDAGDCDRGYWDRDSLNAFSAASCFAACSPAIFLAFSS